MCIISRDNLNRVIDLLGEEKFKQYLNKLNKFEQLKTIKSTTTQLEKVQREIVEINQEDTEKEKKEIEDLKKQIEELKKALKKTIIDIQNNMLEI